MLRKYSHGLSNFRGRNKVFCLTSHFWCWWKLHCSSPIATKGFLGKVCPLFDPGFSGSFPVLAFNTHFHTYLIQYFSQKIPSSIIILFPTSEYLWNPNIAWKGVLSLPPFFFKIVLSPQINSTFLKEKLLFRLQNYKITKILWGVVVKMVMG